MSNSLEGLVRSFIAIKDMLFLQFTTLTTLYNLVLICRKQVVIYVCTQTGLVLLQVLWHVQCTRYNVPDDYLQI